MGVEENKALVGRYLELWSTGNDSIANEILAPDYVDHTHPEREAGSEHVKQEVSMFHTAFPDAHMTVEQMICEGDTVAFRFVMHGTHAETFGPFPPTGSEVVLTGMDFVRIADSKIVELWSSQDTLRWVQQLGAKLQLPTPEEPS